MIPSAGRKAPASAAAFPRTRALGDLRPLLVVVAATLVLRLPGLLEPHHYADEGIFAAVAQRLLQGHPLYAGAWDDKPPLIYWVYAAVLAAAGPSMAALRAAASLWTAVAAAGVTVLGRRMFGRRGGLAAGLLFALLSSLPLIEGNLALTESLAAAPVVWAAVLLSGSRRDVPPSRRRLLGAGALIGLGALSKQVVLLDGAALVLFLALSGAGSPRRLAVLAAGFLLPVAPAGAVLAMQGALGDAAFAMAGFYGVYLREGSGLPPAYAAAKFLPALLALLSAVWAARRRPAGDAALLILWLGFATLGAAMGARPFGHYLVQVLAPASLSVVALAAWRRAEALPGLALTGAASAVVLAAALSGFWLSYPMVRPAYYAETVRYLSGRQSRASFDAYFSWRVANQRRLAALIDRGDERSLFVWGEYPWLYPLAGAENPTRYVTSYQTSFVPGAKREVIETLRRTPPQYIVWEREEWRRLPGLTALLKERYELVDVIDNSELYRRRGPA